MNRRPNVKCELIPVTEYDGVSPLGYDNDGHKYHKDHRGHYLKLSRKTCNLCAKPSMFVGIFHYKKHNRVERFCMDHAKQFSDGPLPPLAEIEVKARESVKI